jgi:exosortase/archaeosortase family protein
MIGKLKKYWASLNYTLRRFILIAILLIISWKLCYHLILKPQRIIDKPLTTITAKITVSTFNFISNDSLTYTGKLPSDNFTHYAEIILRNNHKLLSIADPCNALELMVLYVGFLFCLFTNLKRVIFFSVIGIISIFTLNIIRCTGMIWIAMHQFGWFHIAHHYVFTLVVYSFIFLLWVLYSKSFNTSKNEV